MSDFILDKARSTFLRLSIAGKMLLGYLSLSVIIVFGALFSLSSLDRLNRINDSIIGTDMPLIELADKLIDSTLAQELYGKRYIILGSPDILELFKKRSDEFRALSQQINALPGREAYPVGRLLILHSEYERLFFERFRYRGSPNSPAAREYDQMIRDRQEKLVSLANKLSSIARMNQNNKSLRTARIGSTAFLVIQVVSVLAIITGVGIALAITRNIAGAVNKLKTATKLISEGNFEHRPDIKNRDELGELSQAFGEMAARLKSLEELALDASPLTRLVGGVAIENEVKKRLKAGSAIAFCLLDLDNFKVFNDRYGYARGNEVIQTTAGVIKAAVAEYGADDDFTGHIGGDDFVVITSPARYVVICNRIIDMFDRALPDLYDAEDRDRGCLPGKTRQGQEICFPLISISIGVVTNERRRFTNYLQISEAAAELKEHAKSLAGSIFVVDKRGESADVK